MEQIPDQNIVTDETIVKKTDGSILRYWQLRSRFAKYLKRGSDKKFLLSESYKKNLKNMLVMLLWREGIVPQRDQITEEARAIFDQLVDDFEDARKFLIKKEKSLPLFSPPPGQDTHPEAESKPAA